MATRQREVPEKRGGWFSKSPMSLNAGTGWETPKPAPPSDAATSAAAPASGQTAAPHYLTTSGMFEAPPRPPAWRVEDLSASTPEPVQTPPPLVMDFRSALLQSKKKDDDFQPQKSRKGINALAALGVLLAALAAAIYFMSPAKSRTEIQTAKTWVVKGWTAGVREISTVFHSQTSGQNAKESQGRRRFSPFLRSRQTASLEMPAVPEGVWETQPGGMAARFDLYVPDSFGRRWLLAPTGREFGPIDHLGVHLR